MIVTDRKNGARSFPTHETWVGDRLGYAQWGSFIPNLTDHRLTLGGLLNLKISTATADLGSEIFKIFPPPLIVSFMMRQFWETLL